MHAWKYYIANCEMAQLQQTTEILILHKSFACSAMVYLVYSIIVTGFAKRGLIHASNFVTLMRHNFVDG